MSHFIYKAKKSTGEIYKSEKDAQDRYELYRMLKESGEEVIDVQEKTSKSLSMKNITISLPFLRSVKTQEKINFARNLGSMITAGLAMSRALSVMERQTKNREMKKILISLQKDVSEGKTLSIAMGAFKNVFSSLFTSMVAAGEQSGNLAESLKIVGLQMDKNYALQRKVKGAMMYPSIILIAMILIAVLMLTYIVPTLMKTFTELNLELPLSTKFVLFTSNLVRDHGLVVFLTTAVLIGAFVVWSKRASGKNIIHYAILKIPIIGGIIKEVNAARTARTLSSLLNSGVDVVESVRITKDVIQNVHYKAVLEKAGEAIKKGDPISKIFTENEKLYPLFLGEMMNVGEETGKIGEMLMGVAVFYEDDVEQKTKDMSTIIEPFLMVFIGAAVGFFAVAMISPMYSLVNVI
ncbi:MAG: type pilus assembly protein PilC [Patescibacteria group bacterium]|nr:type pilus assembly protein PilC [Patescibacteria group bacterium]